MQRKADCWHPHVILRIGVLLFLFSSRGSCFALLAHDLRAAVNASLEKVVNCEFDAALSQINALIAVDSSRSVGYLLKMCAIGLRDLDYGCVSDSASFVDAYGRFKVALAADMRATHDTSYALTMLGFARATFAAFCLRARRYREAVEVGFDALDMLKEAQKREPGNADADFFLGLYECARAELRRRLWWILFWYPGSEEEGIRRLERCARSAEFSRLGAYIALADLYARGGKYQRAFALIESTLCAYPQSRFMVWARARCNEMCSNYAAAANDYAILARCYQSLPGAQHSAATTLWHLARMSAAAGQRQQAVGACDTLLILFESHNEEFFRSLVREARRLKERIRRHG